ncbi:hypothetical protein [Candidatus Frankia nodulisporulans]|uniref:hypothetical protein n=1 Tax=Candidatus Frankia nodulisporulans TaxID=2060052 RepID=UPI0013D4AFBB|nr:hypothetical protein [Candidatus Frankia nodulisporulans]
MYLQISPAESLRRALVRDTARFGSPTAMRDRYEARYLPGPIQPQRNCGSTARRGILPASYSPASSSQQEAMIMVLRGRDLRIQQA